MQRQTTRNNNMHIEMLKVVLLTCATTATVLIIKVLFRGRGIYLHLLPPRDIQKSPHFRDFAIQGRNAIKCPCFSQEWGGWTVLELTDVLARGRGGGCFRNFWAGMCYFYELLQLNFATLYQSKLPKSPLSKSSCFPETTEVTSTVV